MLFLYKTDLISQPKTQLRNQSLEISIYSDSLKEPISIIFTEYLQ